MPWISLGSSGSVTRLTTAGMVASLSGDSELKASFRPAGMTSSLTSGLPSRDTCTRSRGLPPTGADAPLIRTRLRSVVDQMPMTGLRMALPLSATSLNGTCRAMVFTLYPASVSCPTSVRSPPYSTSNARRSRKNGSSACPANVDQPPGRVLVAALRRSPYLGIDAGPTRDGATGTFLARTLNGWPLNDDSRVYVWRKSRFSSSSDVTGPLLYRNVLLPRRSWVWNVYRKTASAFPSPSLSTLMLYVASVANG